MRLVRERRALPNPGVAASLPQCLARRWKAFSREALAMPASKPLSHLVLKGFCSVSVFLVVLFEPSNLPYVQGLPSDIRIGKLISPLDLTREDVNKPRFVLTQASRFRES
ncbi:hypothetical protein TNIN_113441 [Trichonephila inaurata madagascariensis]|uniref:Uncharacterized protein n=1 Tax=Trichonephila inaurata madagascariensis TaxID=2747483 RepID=A0A8X7CNR0_9ARAC|nr:hypothetical protein TNIN_113441 [Trichonephila inaurata madagascariensis]